MSGLNPHMRSDSSAPAGSESIGKVLQAGESVRSTVTSLRDTMGFVQASAVYQKGQIDQAVRHLGTMPEDEVMVYLEEHPELKQLLGIK